MATTFKLTPQILTGFIQELKSRIWATMTNLEKLKIIESLFHDTYLIEDEGIIKLLCATIIANRFNGDPVWLFIVGPSGAGKTEFINSINNISKVFTISSITSRTLISGKKSRAEDEEASLLLRIGTFGIITFKDFTTMLTLQHEERNAIMGQLREVYDGAMTRVFGNGLKVEWRGKVGLIAGVTYVIHIARDLYSAMGERFIMYALNMPDRKKMSQRAMENSPNIREKRKLLQDKMTKLLDEDKEKGGFGFPQSQPSIDSEINNDILDLAELSTRARSPVEREWRSPNKDILYVHPPEIPTRFAIQLASLASALKYINDGPLQPEDRRILFKIALDSITDTRRIALKELASYDEVETAGLATKVDYPTSTVRRWLEDLNALKVIERVKTSGKADRWKLKPNYRDLIRKFDGIESAGTELTEDIADGKTDLLTLALQAQQKTEASKQSEEAWIEISVADKKDEQSLDVYPDEPQPML